MLPDSHDEACKGEDGMITPQHVIDMGFKARNIQQETRDPKIQRLATNAVNHFTAALQAHNEGSYDSSNMHIEEGRKHLMDAALLHSKTHQDPVTLDVGVLGDVPEQARYLEDINEGLKNGRKF